MLRRFGLAEDSGQGIDVIEDNMRMELLAEPVFKPRARDVLGVDSTEARSRLQRLRDAGIVVQHGTRGRAYYTLGALGPDRTDQQVVLDLASIEPITNERVRQVTGLDRVAARSLLRRLVEEGQLVQHGERRATYYTLPKARKRS